MLANRDSPLPGSVAVDGERCPGRAGRRHAAERGGAVDPDEFGDGERDRDVLLEGDPGEAAHLLVGDRLRVDLDQRGAAAGGLAPQDVHPVLLGGDADAAGRHRPGQRTGDVVQGGAHLGEVVLADVADHADRGLDQLALVDLLQGGHDRHALDDQRVRAVRGGAADDADLLDDVGDPELAVDRLLLASGVMNRAAVPVVLATVTRPPPRSAPAHSRVIELLPRMPLTRTRRGMLLQVAVVAALLDKPGDQRDGAAQGVEGEVDRSSEFPARTTLSTSRAARPVVRAAVVVVPVRGTALDDAAAAGGRPQGRAGSRPERRGTQGGGWRGRGRRQSGGLCSCRLSPAMIAPISSMRCAGAERGRGFAPSGGGDRRGVGSRARSGRTVAT